MLRPRTGPGRHISSSRRRSRLYRRYRRFSRVLLTAALLGALCAPTARAYSVLTHEEIVDLSWQSAIVPLLRTRYPGITDAQLKEAHAYAYGGCILQDLGYYPRGSKFFSDLTHYVRTGEFVETLLRDSTTPDELAFALGALAHYTSDETGHPYINQVTAQQNPKLERRFGQTVTYEDNPTAHLRTEFGFDVVGVARSKYAQEDYRQFIGFEVAKPLLERAFQETYGLPLKSVIRNEDLSIGSARWAVSTLIPKVTRVALLTYHGEIEQANPGFDRNKFLYRFSRTEYERSWGKNYKKPGIGSHLLAAVIRVVPKVGPFKALKLQMPNADQQTIYLHSVNQTTDLLNARIGSIQRVAQPTKVPAIAASNGKRPDSGTLPVAAEASPDKNASSSTERGGAKVIHAGGRMAPAKPFSTVPFHLSSVDLDTGRPVSPGEYRLGDKAHAELLSRVVTLPPDQVSPDLRDHLLAYFNDNNTNRLQRDAKQWRKVQANLQRLRSENSSVVAASK